MATETQGGFPQHEGDDEPTTGTTVGTTVGTTALEDTTTGDGHPPRAGE